MKSTNILIIGLLALSTACSSFNNKSSSRYVADDGRFDRGERHDGFDIGDYTSQRINNFSGFIDVSAEFSSFRGLGGRNFKGLLIEARRMDIGDPRDMRDPRDMMDPRNMRDPRALESSDIVMTLDQMPTQRFQMVETSRMQYFYVDLNREFRDNFGALNIQYNPSNTLITKLTVLTNDERPWDVRPPVVVLPPVILPPQNRLVTVTSNGSAGTSFGNRDMACNTAFTRAIPGLSESCAGQRGLYMNDGRAVGIRRIEDCSCVGHENSKGEHSTKDMICSITVSGTCSISH